MRLSAMCRAALAAISLLAVPAFPQTPAAPDNLWNLLDNILKQPIDKQALQALLGAEPAASNEQYGAKYLWTQALSFTDGLQLKQATLIATRDPLHNTVGLDVSGRCLVTVKVRAD